MIESKMESVRRVGFEVTYRWFVSESASTTFVVKEQSRVCRSLPPEKSSDEEIKKQWEVVRADYLSIPDDCIKPWDLANKLIRPICA
jgi:hypothetical protein